MPNPTVRIHNTETNEIIDRPMTNAEFAAYQQEIAAIETKQAAKAAKEATKQSVLEKLGLTAEELASIL